MSADADHSPQLSERTNVVFFEYVQFSSFYIQMKPKRHNIKSLTARSCYMRHDWANHLIRVCRTVAETFKLNQTREGGWVRIHN